MAANVSYEGLQPFLFLILSLKFLDLFDSQAGDIGIVIIDLPFIIILGTFFLAHVATRSKFFQTSENGVPTS